MAYNVYLVKRRFSICNSLLQRCSKSTRIGPPWKVLFFGTDEFSLASLRPLCSKMRTGTLMDELGVVTKMGSAVAKFSESENLPHHYWPLENPNISSKYDLGIVVSFGHLIPKAVIESLPMGCINVHASLLPKWRGAAPIIHAVMSGDLETGVTIMKVKPHKFDIGEIIRQYRVPITWNETARTLEKRLAAYGAQLLMECIRDLPRCIIMATPQPNFGITHAPKIMPSMAIINWDLMSAESIYNRHRALCHIYPLTTKWQNVIVKLHSIELVKEFSRPFYTPEHCETSKKTALDFLSSDTCNYQPQKLIQTKETPIDGVPCGSLKYDRKNKILKILCADYHYISVDNISIGGKLMKAHDFYNGFMSKTEKIYWRFST
ncbi:hypothetical protein AAG570_010384 [Ranatra chinensis]|uniref:methionyl-tRNA formyltransferase n=1 Tax=Ranatra chinensis TaxID=642074 RepID=A0ABD0YMG4_9HEMI